MQVGELKSLLETINCETHLVLSAHIKEQDSKIQKVNDRIEMSKAPAQVATIK